MASGLATLGSTTPCADQSGYGKMCKERYRSDGSCCCTEWTMKSEARCRSELDALSEACLTPEEFERRRREILDSCCYYDDIWNGAHAVEQPAHYSRGACEAMLGEMEEACGGEREALREDFARHCCLHSDLQAAEEEIPDGAYFPCEDPGTGSGGQGSTGDVIIGDGQPCDPEVEMCVGQEQDGWLKKMLEMLPLIPAILQMLFGDKGSEEFDLGRYTHEEAAQALALYAALGVGSGMLLWWLLFGGKKKKKEQEQPIVIVQEGGAAGELNAAGGEGEGE